MDIVQVLRELAKHPLPDEAFAMAARAIVLAQEPGIELGVAAPNHSVPLAVIQRGIKALELKSARESDFIRITVKDGANHRTTACFARGFHDRAVLRLGGPRQVSELVRKLARRVPDGVANRSGWIQTQIEYQLASPRDT